MIPLSRELDQGSELTIIRGSVGRGSSPIFSSLTHSIVRLLPLWTLTSFFKRSTHLAANCTSECLARSMIIQRGPEPGCTSSDRQLRDHLRQVQHYCIISRRLASHTSAAVLWRMRGTELTIDWYAKRCILNDEEGALKDITIARGRMEPRKRL